MYGHYLLRMVALTCASTKVRFGSFGVFAGGADGLSWVVGTMDAMMTVKGDVWVRIYSLGRSTCSTDLFTSS